MFAEAVRLNRREDAASQRNQLVMHTQILSEKFLWDIVLALCVRRQIHHSAEGPAGAMVDEQNGCLAVMVHYVNGPSDGKPVQLVDHVVRFQVNGRAIDPDVRDAGISGWGLC